MRRMVDRGAGLAVLPAELGDGQAEGVGELEAALGVGEELQLGAVQGGDHRHVATAGDAVQRGEVVQVQYPCRPCPVGGQVTTPVVLDGTCGLRGDGREDPVGDIDAVLVDGVEGYGLGEGVLAQGVVGCGRVVVGDRQRQTVVEGGGVGVRARLPQGAGEDSGRAAGGERLLGEVLDDEGGSAARVEKDAVVHGRVGAHGGVFPLVGVPCRRGKRMGAAGRRCDRRRRTDLWRAADQPVQSGVDPLGEVLAFEARCVG